ncbi:NAD(P)/FAD-dependent oxidoreductase [Gluconacetobacter asukensis]|uniref:NAD(P)/FAD-dependent oxidoreductase n=2 Tax=Gluconacetobacter asukensis TaxID=1017181 RepID=A0A7W4IZE0_9PROT|nr:NAD(P)/FAD-dependent oxidoreductase [Gluconacetobacter asukensis]
MTTRLADLKRKVQRELEWIDFPAKTWVRPHEFRGRTIHDAVVIGAGMAGLAVSASLKRYGIANHVVLDMAPARQEGPWVTYARMETLRSPKILPGPCLNIPVLTFRSWFEHCHGEDAWAGLGLIPRGMWMDYLIWFRDVLDLPVENNVKVLDVDPVASGVIRLTIERDGQRQEIFTRKAILATGRDGSSSQYLPPVIADLPGHLRAHAADPIDFSALAGRRVAVIGAGASAMDNAATALENGAARVDLLIRRSDLPRINKYLGLGYPGSVNGFAGLSDAWKIRFLDYVMSAQTPPPRPSVLRVSRHPNAFFHLDCGLLDAREEGDAVALKTTRGTMTCDFLIAATGFDVSLARRPELHRIAPGIRLWKDRLDAMAGQIHCNEINGELASSPDLGPNFEFQPKTGMERQGLDDIHCFSFAASLSLGKVSGDIPAISDGADKLVRGIAAQFFQTDAAWHFANLEQFTTPEIFGDEWCDTALPTG